MALAVDQDDHFHLNNHLVSLALNHCYYGYPDVSSTQWSLWSWWSLWFFGPDNNNVSLALYYEDHFVSITIDQINNCDLDDLLQIMIKGNETNFNERIYL